MLLVSRGDESMPTVKESDVIDVPTTKEELEEWRKQQAKKRRGHTGGTPRSPERDREQQGGGGFEDDVRELIAFLMWLIEVMEKLIKERIPEDQAELFIETFPDIEYHIQSAISDLREIDSTEHVLYRALQVEGLTGKPRQLKTRELSNRVHHSPVASVLEMADNILESLFEVLTQLSPVKEFKEALESGIKHGGDRGIISINWQGNEQWWNEKTAKGSN